MPYIFSLTLLLLPHLAKNPNIEIRNSDVKP
jgi:hypothetical protein